MDEIKTDNLKLDGNAQIIKVLSKNLEIVSKFSEFQSALEQLDSKEKKLMVFNSLLTKDTLATEKAKNDLRNELVEKILPVITILQIFAYDKKKKKLLQRLECLNSEYLKNCSDIALIKISKKIWMIANKYGGYSLAFVRKIKSSLNSNKSKAIIKLEKEYGLMPDMVKRIEETNIRFIESLLLYRDEMKEKERIKGKINKINKQTENLLENKIDRFMLLIEKEKPAVFKEYRQERENKLLSDLKEAQTIDQKTELADLPVENHQVVSVEQVEQKTPRRVRPAKKVVV